MTPLRLRQTPEYRGADQRKIQVLWHWLTAVDKPSVSEIEQQYYEIDVVVGSQETNTVVKQDRLEQIREYLRDWIVVEEEAEEFDEIINFGEDYYVEAEPFDWDEAMDFHEALERARRCRGLQDHRRG